MQLVVVEWLKLTLNGDGYVARRLAACGEVNGAYRGKGNVGVEVGRSRGWSPCLVLGGCDGYDPEQS